MQGRITERQLPAADESIPGIRRYYEQLDEKPATFLDLLWQYEGRRVTCRKAAVRRKRSRR